MEKQHAAAPATLRFEYSGTDNTTNTSHTNRGHTSRLSRFDCAYSVAPHMYMATVDLRRDCNPTAYWFYMCTLGSECSIPFFPCSYLNIRF
ncbi:hypothetical protein EYC84_009585 [Monilinia fructicola]|uniref:Uncharacterized protein n=1 Tax=Monilinia fructicola TaxID=38448 RepID=A0A5M9JD47_MONFR|nr:hypothetical protein EYC84_009585 [Monilinia fructicola]